MKMQTFRKPHQWLNFWLEKYADVLSGLKYSSEQRKQYWAMLKVFLEELPGNPRNIPLDKVQAFIESNPEERLMPVTLFFQKIAPSKPHLELLKEIDEAFDSKSSDQSDDPIQQFSTMLSDKQLSPRTVKNYSSALKVYLKWLVVSPTKTTVNKIPEYCTFLADEKKLSQRTISLHTAALKLFYKQVSEASNDL